MSYMYKINFHHYNHPPQITYISRLKPRQGWIAALILTGEATEFLQLRPNKVHVLLRHISARTGYLIKIITTDRNVRKVG